MRTAVVTRASSAITNRSRVVVHHEGAAIILISPVERGRSAIPRKRGMIVSRGCSSNSWRHMPVASTTEPGAMSFPYPPGKPMLMRMVRFPHFRSIESTFSAKPAIAVPSSRMIFPLNAEFTFDGPFGDENRSSASTSSALAAADGTGGASMRNNDSRNINRRETRTGNPAMVTFAPIGGYTAFSASRTSTRFRFSFLM